MFIGNPIEEVNCKVCNTKEKPEKILEYRGLELSRCKKCGVVYANKRLFRELLRDNVYSKYVPSMFFPGQEGAKKEQSRIEDAKHELEIIQKYIKIGKLADIGTAAGTFMNVAREYGFQVYGTDLSEASIRIGKTFYDLDIFKGDIEEFTETNFDVIVMWNVLEHLYEPYQELKYLTTHLLKDKGIVLIKVPNHTTETLIENPMLPEHIFNYNLDSLKYLFESVGLKIIETQYGMDDKLPTITMVAQKEEKQ